MILYLDVPRRCAVPEPEMLDVERTFEERANVWRRMKALAPLLFDAHLRA